MDIIVMFAAVVLVVFFFIGYLMNIVRLASSKTLTGLSLLRVIGVFAFPMGGLLGWIKDVK